MARQPKIPQYEDFNQRSNCFGDYQRHQYKLTDWRLPDLPLMIELGAGRAQTSLVFAHTHPDWQVLAVDLKSDRLNKAASSNPPKNLAFWQAHADQLADAADWLGRVGLIWLAFPDPSATRRRLKHRLLNPERLALWHRLLIEGGLLRFKTDHKSFFNDSRQLIDDHPGWRLTVVDNNLKLDDSYPADVLTPTPYEMRFRSQNQSIRYLEAQAIDPV